MAGGNDVGNDIRTWQDEVPDMLLEALAQERCLFETFRQGLSSTQEMRFANLEVAALCEAAHEEANVGGDFCDAFALNAGKVALVIGDICGKGVEAAVHTEQLKYTVRAYLRESPNPAHALARVNRFVCDTHRLESRNEYTFTVMALAIVDPASGDTVLSTAGAEPPLVLRGNGETRAMPTMGNLPVGIEPGETYSTTSLRLGMGDTLLLATDGITEARQGRNFLGYEGMTALAQQAAEQSSLERHAEAILKGAQRFAGGPLHDDACLLLARRKA